METRITNLTVKKQPIRELYSAVPAGIGQVLSTTALYAPDLQKMTDLQSKVAEGLVEVAIVPTAAEIASGLLGGLDMGQPAAVAPVLDTNVDNAMAQASQDIIIRRFFAAGAGGAPDDVTIFGEGLMPHSLGPKYRVLDAFMLISVNVAAMVVTVRNRAAGVGDQLAVLDAATTGLKRPTAMGAGNVTVLTTLDATHGLVLRRGDSAIAGEIFITLRKEN